MLHLPVELQRHCVQYLNVEGLKSLRTVNKSIHSLSTEALFRTVTLFHYDESATKYIKILEDSKLNPLVRKVIFDTSSPDDEDLASNEEKDLNEEFRSAMRAVGRFENLCEVELNFSDDCAASNPDAWEKEVQESVEFRRRILKKFFKALNLPTNPATKVDSLSIKNLQDHTDMEIYNNENFKAVRSRLKKLALQIVTEYDDAAPENSIGMLACHQMFNKDLCDHWLKPLQDQLTQLTIYCDVYWGVWPYCDLRQVHFPHLKSLSLGNFSIVNNWQIDWILSHASTLEELILNDCPIIVNLKIQPDQCAPNFPELRSAAKEKAAEDEDSYFFYKKEVDLRWHQILPRFQKGLPHLKRFAFGRGSWDGDWSFEERYLMPTTLERDRYYSFECGMGPSPWMEFDYGMPTYGMDSPPPEQDDTEIPDYDTPDKHALEELVSLVEVRNRT